MIPLPVPERLIEELLAIHEEHGRHIDEGYLRGVHETNDRFHLTLFGACGNKYLVQTIELYMRFSLPVRANSMGDRASLQVSHEPASADDRHAAGAATTGCSRSSASTTCSRASGAISSRSGVRTAGPGFPDAARVNGDSLNAQTMHHSCTRHARAGCAGPEG